MTKLASRIVTGIAILGLAAPAFAATTSKSANAAASPAQTSVVHHNRTYKHKKLAQADEKKANPKKAEKKVEKKDSAKGATAKTPATPSATPAPASK
jgi:hypothetical protein